MFVSYRAGGRGAASLRSWLVPRCWCARRLRRDGGGTGSVIGRAVRRPSARPTSAEPGRGGSRGRL